MFLGIGAIPCIAGIVANMMPNINSKSFKTSHEPLDATTKQKKTIRVPIIPKYEWQEDFNESEYHGETYMPPFEFGVDRCIKKVKKLYYEHDYKYYKWYCLYKDFWVDFDLCKNCKYNPENKDKE